MHSRRGLRPTLALLALGALGAGVQAQTASALLREDDVLGPPGHTVSSLNNTAVNHVGGYAITVNTSDGVETLSHVWGEASGGAGGVLRSEGTFGDYEQTSFESFYGIANDGTVAYSATSNNTSSGSTSLDGVWLGDAPIAVEEELSSEPGFWWSFGSRPGVTGSGTPYFVGGITDTLGGSTDNRGLFLGLGATSLILGFQDLPGVPFTLSSANTVSFDYRFSAEAGHYLAEVQMQSGSSTDDNVMTMDGAGLMVGGALVREGDPVPVAAGGLVGENWDNFDFTGATESGKWFFTGDTDGDSSTDEIVVVDGEIVFREGDVIDGEVVEGSIEGAYLNEQGDLALIWDTDGGALESLFFNGQLMLREGDPVDLDGDGAVDAGTSISSFTGISTLTVSDQGPGGVVQIYFTADVDTQGTSSTSDDVEGFFCMEAEGAECFIVIGPGPGSSTFHSSSHAFATQLADVDAFYAVTMEEYPSFTLPQLHELFAVAEWLPQGGAVDPQDQTVEFSVQVLMHNPFVFPDDPSQWTEGLQVSISPEGRVRVAPFGEAHGMQIWPEVGVDADGVRTLSFPFSIDALGS